MKKKGEIHQINIYIFFPSNWFLHDISTPSKDRQGGIIFPKKKKQIH
jgi:hypothetical protein